MARLRSELLDRVEEFACKSLDVAEAMEVRGVSRRLVDQIAAAATSVGANVFEADEAMSRADFVKCLAIATKELSEVRFWVRIAVKRGWVSQQKAGSVLVEGVELRRILGTMIVRTKKGSPYGSRSSQATAG
ncbi:MAG: four helix bundle protein [Planctomycetota bacterium]|nr:four helix bundle protein [Planctomycetota bacterium]